MVQLDWWNFYLVHHYRFHKFIVLVMIVRLRFGFMHLVGKYCFDLIFSPLIYIRAGFLIFVVSVGLGTYYDHHLLNSTSHLTMLLLNLLSAFSNTFYYRKP